MSISNDITEIKIIIIGKSDSGKTSYVNRRIKNTFSEARRSTIVSEFSSKIYNYKNKLYKINLWDIAGQDHFPYLIKAFCKDAKGCITLSNILLPSTLDDAKEWKETLDKNQTFPDGSLIPNILIQNKVDLIKKENNNDNNNDEMIEEFAKKNKFDAWFKTPAKTGENVNESMDKMLELIINKLNYFNTNYFIEHKNTLSLKTDQGSEIDKIRKSTQNNCC